MATPYFGPGGQSMTLGKDEDKWSDVVAEAAHIDSFKGKGSATVPVYMDANGVPQPVTSYAGKAATAGTARPAPATLQLPPKLIQPRPAPATPRLRMQLPGCQSSTASFALPTLFEFILRRNINGNFDKTNYAGRNRIENRGCD